MAAAKKTTKAQTKKTSPKDQPKPQSTWDMDLPLPQLFLVCRTDVVGLPSRDWYHLDHQTGGISCHRKVFYGTPLQPNGKVAMGLAQLSEYYYYSNLSCWGLALDEAVEYQERLKKLGLDCQYGWKDLQEGYYPIDLPDNLSEFVEDELPEDLDDLLDWRGHQPIAKIFGIVGRWSLAWVSTNSD